MNGVVTFLLLSSLANNLCWCAPRHEVSARNANSDAENEIIVGAIQEEQLQTNKLMSEIKSGLHLVQLLPSEISQRKVNEAVVVLGQVLENPNPILHTAVENALRDVSLIPEVDNSVTSKLLSYLDNLKQQLSLPGNSFPQKFSEWMKNQIAIVESTVAFNIDGINKLREKDGDMNSIVDDFESQIHNFGSFMQKGLEIFTKQSTLQFDIELNNLKNAFKDGETYHQVIATIVWNLMTENQVEDNNVLSSMSFMAALEEVHKRASPELQPMPQAALRSIRIFFKSLTPTDHAAFLHRLGYWSPTETLDSNAPSSTIP